MNAHFPTCLPTEDIISLFMFSFLPRQIPEVHYRIHTCMAFTACGLMAPLDTWPQASKEKDAAPGTFGVSGSSAVPPGTCSAP